ncbi:MAG: phosphopantetheine-binding protein [Fimbriimonadales bacterium]
MEGELSPQQDAVYQRLRKVASRLWDRDEADLTLDFDVFNQVDVVDSLDMVELVTVMESELGVRLGDDEIRGVRTLRDLVLLISSRM